jgi:nitronate monooxygenase
VRENRLLQKLGIEVPIVLAPMAGGPGTPELAAAVSNAGGLGSLGAAYLRPEEIVDSIRRTRALTDRPFAVNLFAGGYPAGAAADPAAMVDLLTGIHHALALKPPVVPVVPPDPFREQFEAVLEARPAAFSFTFGIPAADVFRRLRAREIAILGTATTAGEARLLVDAGVDAVVAQGAEAGSHRGTFAVPFEAAMVPTLDLVREIAGFAEVIAAGGIMDGRDLAIMLANGAVAAQLGTAFLTCPESGAPPAYKGALMRALDGATVVTRAFSGRPARGLANTFTGLLAANEGAILPYPLQNFLTRPMRAAAAAQGNSEFLSLWAGQGVARTRQMPAGELVAILVEESRAVSDPLWRDTPTRNSIA